jgi:alpha-1,2-mannosyltransferase
VVANALSVTMNHIDDTDETFGYWEPLHYLLHGVGMQVRHYPDEIHICL